MKTYNIRTLEQWEMVVEYSVKDNSLDEAKQAIEAGEVAYDNKENTGSDKVVEYLIVEEEK